MSTNISDGPNNTLNDSLRFQSNRERYRKLCEAVSLAKMMLCVLLIKYFVRGIFPRKSLQRKGRPEILS